MNTIAAISTPMGVGGISIIRISGKDALNIVKKIFIPKNKGEYKSYNIKLGTIIDKDKKVIDEVLVSYFKAPRTYTGEDVCEINCHGGNLVVKRILEEILKNGAAMAEPGEFTKRAFLNGRMDLSQAEAVIDIINSKSIKENKASLNQLRGYLSKEIKEIRDSLLNLLIDIEANIDYPEYDIEEVSKNRINTELEENIDKLIKLEKSFEDGKILRNGVNTVIIGKPNVGKSSLLNVLLKEERAIVTEIAGTTRDTIEEYITIKGIPLKIIDTAGIRIATDKVEEIGIEKTKNAMKNAELILMMIDASMPLSDEDKDILNEIENKKCIILLNKSDIGNKINIEELNFENIIQISAKTLEGIDKLENKIEELFNISKIEVDEEIVITNIRHKALISKAINGMKIALNNMHTGTPIDILSIQIKDALESLGEITGETVSEDIIKGIFEKFCVGK